VRFGIRNVTFDTEIGGARLLRVNGKRVYVRGGGWASDMMLRPISPERLDAELDYVKDLGLNTIPLEGKLQSDAFYARTDDYGILVLPGWMCCDRWQASGDWSDAEHAIAIASMDAQAKRLRNHPSVVDFLIGSDEIPSPQAEGELMGTLAANDWPNPV